MSVNICLIGLGYMGVIHLNKLLSMEDVIVSGIVDIDKEKGDEISKKYNVPFIKDYREIFKISNDINGVVISSPTDTHYQIATYFMEKGVHVFLEKPMAKDINEATSLINLSKKNDIILQVGHLERFNPAFKKALNFIKAPIMIEARRTGPHTGRSTDINVVFDLMIHDIDLMLSITKGDLDCNIKSYGITLVNKSFDVANAFIEFKNGIKGTLYANRVSKNKERLFTIFERDKIIYTDLLNGTLTVMSKKQGNEIEFNEYNTGKIDSVREELNEFIEAIKGQTIPTVQGIDGFKAVKLAKLISSSIEK